MEWLQEGARTITMIPRCLAEFHSLDGSDSLSFGSHTLFCRSDKGHDGVHEFYGGLTSIIDNRESCNCRRCNPINTALQSKLDAKKKFFEGED